MKARFKNALLAARLLRKEVKGAGIFALLIAAAAGFMYMIHVPEAAE